MTGVEELINALHNDKTSDANKAFASAMNSKIADAIDDRKLSLANQVYNGVEQEITDTNGDEDV